MEFNYLILFTRTLKKQNWRIFLANLKGVFLLLLADYILFMWTEFLLIIYILLSHGLLLFPWLHFYGLIVHFYSLFLANSFDFFAFLKLFIFFHMFFLKIDQPIINTRVNIFDFLIYFFLYLLNFFLLLILSCRHILYLVFTYLFPLRFFVLMIYWITRWFVLFRYFFFRAAFIEWLMLHEIIWNSTIFRNSREILKKLLFFIRG